MGLTEEEKKKLGEEPVYISRHGKQKIAEFHGRSHIVRELLEYIEVYLYGRPRNK